MKNMKHNNINAALANNTNQQNADENCNVKKMQCTYSEQQNRKYSFKMAKVNKAMLRISGFYDSYNNIKYHITGE